MWATAVMVFALVMTNPLYMLVLLLIIIFVGLIAPRTEFAVAGFRTMFVAGLGLLAFSVLIASINGGYGERTLFTVPGPSLPAWLGGLRLGGPVTAEALVAASIRGLAILCVFLGFAVFNGAASPYRILRLGPAALFQAGLVVTIGLTLLPASIEDFRRLRELRALRGSPGGLRSLPGMVVPAVIGGLERAMRFAEAIEARGYAAPEPLPPLARLAGLASMPLLLVACWAWLYLDDTGLAALAAFSLAAASGATWAVLSARARRTTRMSPEPFPLPDRVAAATFALVAIAAISARTLGWIQLTYNPFAGLRAPSFDLGILVLALPLLAPAFLLLRLRTEHVTTVGVADEPPLARSLP